jgi:5-formyltetrahydrofolate cyclo-ligase
MKEQRRQLRLPFIAQRLQLTTSQQQSASKLIAEHVIQTVYFQQSHNIAFYLAAKGEVDPGIILQEALEKDKTCFLPILHPQQHNHLKFGRYEQGAPLAANDFGILEPTGKVACIEPSLLDLVITPLVAFDVHGHRLGMGGGFYDRTFAFKHANPHRQPLLMGVGYHFQRCLELPTQSWDVPLDIAVTDQAIFYFNDGLRTP